MEFEGYLGVIRDESERFLEALAGVAPEAPVPSCDGWDAAALMWHLAEVQHFWAEVVGKGLDGDAVVEPARPADGADLGDLVARAGTELLTALAARGPDEPCWSWHDAGHCVGWVARRQAHEALIHRVDAARAAGLPVRPPAADLAADGVDEVLLVMVDGVPGWGVFTPDGVHVRLACSNVPAVWVLSLGRFTGTGPESGTTHDLDAAAVRRVTPGEGDGPADVGLDVVGHAWDLDRWLWGRGGTEALEVRGDPGVLARLRALVAEATQ